MNKSINIWHKSLSQILSQNSVVRYITLQSEDAIVRANGKSTRSVIQPERLEEEETKKALYMYPPSTTLCDRTSMVAQGFTGGKESTAIIAEEFTDFSVFCNLMAEAIVLSRESL